MKYRVTQKAVDDGRYEETGEITILAVVDGYIEKMIELGYYEEINT